jgi:hypothetical protein
MEIKVYTVEELKQIPTKSVVHTYGSGEHVLLIKSNKPWKLVWVAPHEIKKEWQLAVPFLNNTDYLVLLHRELFLYKNPDLNAIFCLRQNKLPPKNTYIDADISIKDYFTRSTPWSKYEKEPFERIKKGSIVVKGQERNVEDKDLMKFIKESIHLTLPYLDNNQEWTLIGDDSQSQYPRQYYRFVPAKLRTVHSSSFKHGSEDISDISIDTCST